ncbi:MAG: hypothetical protein GXY83_09055 [Rhodopirellula sp.]|nr:hypothetical protein [Rhodopirellula sp.]
MTTLFVICAVAGGTVLVLQFIMTLVGLGGDSFEIDGADAAGDLPTDTGGMLDHTGDMSGDASADVHADAHGHHHSGHAGSSRLLGMVSFRTLVAAITFFGLGGLIAREVGAPPFWMLVVALVSGFSAMYGVYRILRGLYAIHSEGTARVDRAVGLPATVYLRIPADGKGTGKIHVNLQNRTMEYLAVSSGDAIPTGSKVIVVKIVSTDTVEVEPALEPERIEHA